MILVPMDAPASPSSAFLTVYGYDDAPHGHMEIALKNVRVPASNLLLGEGRGFEIAQGRLGPGRIHHCMRTIGAAEEALGAMARRLQSGVAFGKRLSEHSVWEQRVAEARIEIDCHAPAVPQGGRHDGQGRQQGRQGRDRDDQGEGAEDGAEDHRRRDPGAWRGRGQPGHAAGGELGRDPHTAPRRRAGRSPQPVHRADRICQACGGAWP